MNLYGDGIHDDAPAIQELLDSGISEVILPTPKVHYCIGKTLKIHGGQTLKTGRTTVIKLMKDVDAAMIEDDDFDTHKENICIDGGIWDMNCEEQSPNPYHFPDKSGKTAYEKMEEMGITYQTITSFVDMYSGMCMRFCRIKYLNVKNLTIKNPVVYGIQIAHIKYFTFENIIFDYQKCNPKYWNMDGIHIEGHCSNGTIKNLQGDCHDDMVAITADDGLYGPVKNITVDGLYTEHCHSAVRLLSHGFPVENIHICNVYGNFYTYCIGLTKYHGDESERGTMKNIFIENVCAAACEGTKDVPGGNFPFIWVQKCLDIKNLHISKVSREEKSFKTPMIKIDKNATVDGCVISDIKQVSLMDGKIEQLVINGDVTGFSATNLVNL